MHLVMSQAAERGARVIAGAALALAGLVAVPSCTVPSRQEPGQATAAVRDAVAQATSAVETTRLTLRLFDDDRIPSTVADTALLDQLRVLDEASTALTTLVPPDDASAAHRAASADAVDGAVTSVVDARAWVAREAGGNLSADGGVPTSYDELASDLTDVADGLGQAYAEAGGQ